MGGGDNREVLCYRIRYCWVPLSVTDTITHLASQVMIHLTSGLPLTAGFPKKVNLTGFVYKSRAWGPFLTPTSFKPFKHDSGSSPSKCCFTHSNSGCATERFLEMFPFLFPFGSHDNTVGPPSREGRVNAHQLRMWEC